MRFPRTLDAVSQLSTTFRKLPNDLIFAIRRPFEGKVAAEEYSLAGMKLGCHNGLRLHEPCDQRCRIGLIRRWFVLLELSQKRALSALLVFVTAIERI